MKKKWFWIAVVLMILFGFSIGYWFQRNKNSNTGQTESQTKLKENTKETGETYTGITSEEETETADTDPEESQTESVTEGTEEYRGFVIDNVLQSEKEGDIHYNVYIPESYDGTKAYALYFTLPGYEGLYFQGVAANIRSEDFGFEAQKYNSEMIIVAPQLNDWGETSADQTIALVEYFLEHYNIDQEKVYASGYSGGGETMGITDRNRQYRLTRHCMIYMKNRD